MMWSSACRLLNVCVFCCFMMCNVCWTIFPFYGRGFWGQHQNVRSPLITGSAWQGRSPFDTSSFNSGNMLQSQSKCDHSTSTTSGSAGYWERRFPHDDVCAYCNRKVVELGGSPNYCQRYLPCRRNSFRNSGVRYNRFIPEDIGTLVCTFCDCIANKPSCECNYYCGDRNCF